MKKLVSLLSLIRATRYKKQRFRRLFCWDLTRASRFSFLVRLARTRTICAKERGGKQVRDGNFVFGHRGQSGPEEKADS